MSDFQKLAAEIGVHFMGVNPEFQAEGAAKGLRIAADGSLALDAQPTLVTTSNSGIPAFLSTYIDPKLIDVLVSPMKAAEVAGNERKLGDWTTNEAKFPVVESTGITSAYGDYSESGNAGVNTNFPSRQSFHYQVVTQWGEREMANAGLAKIDWANRVNVASVLTLNKYQNKTYFYGVSNLQCYGLLNDPNLPSAIVPTTKAATGTSWAAATPNEVLADIQKLFKQLQTQANGLVSMDDQLTLALSPLSEVYLANTSSFGLRSAKLMIKDNFPNLKIVTAPEYSTGSGELVQLIVDEYEGQRTVDVAFTEKLRAHPIVVAMSSFRQKKSQGTWGAVIYRPAFIASMLGV